MANITKEERARRAALIAESAPEPDPNDISPKAASVEPPAFSIAERRLKYGDVAMMKGQADFDLVGLDEPMAVYWGMTEDAYDLVNLKGWQPVHKQHLPMEPSRLGLTSAPDGYVTRGRHGSEMLFMMPKRLRESILMDQEQRRQVMRRSRRMWQQQNMAAAEQDAQNEALTDAQRASARRASLSMQDEKRAKWTPLESIESHGTEPLG